MRRDPAVYDKLANSIAPNVFGHTDVKRAVLLMLLGGVQKQTKEVRAWGGVGGWVGGMGGVWWAGCGGVCGGRETLTRRRAWRTTKSARLHITLSFLPPNTHVFCTYLGASVAPRRR